MYVRARIMSRDITQMFVNARRNRFINIPVYYNFWMDTGERQYVFSLVA